MIFDDKLACSNNFLEKPQFERKLLFPVQNKVRVLFEINFNLAVDVSSAPYIHCVVHFFLRLHSEQS